MIVSEEGFKIIQFTSDFNQWALKAGIKDPFHISMRNLVKDDKGYLQVIEPQVKVSQEEKDSWIMMRNQYVAKRCFYEIGYNAFWQQTEPKERYDISFMRTQPEFVPCRSFDGQCRLDCYKFGDKCDEKNLEISIERK